MSWIELNLDEATYLVFAIFKGLSDDDQLSLLNSIEAEYGYLEEDAWLWPYGTED